MKSLLWQFEQARQALQASIMPPRAFSLAGTLYMKPIGGALTILRSKKKFYFAIDELSERLLYYKDEADLVCKRDPVGEIPLEHAAFTTVEGNPYAFVVNYEGKKVELEAENQDSCDCWMEALSRRYTRIDGRKMSRISGSPFRRRDRSNSLPLSEDDHLFYGKSNLLTTERGRAPRKTSYNPEETSSELALSVLEERLQQLTPIGAHIAQMEQPPSPVPPWLDDWVNHWLQQQSFNQKDTDGNSETSSTATSPYRSPEESSMGSEKLEMDEMQQMRMISNHQKLRIHELSQEKKALTEQIVLFRQKSESSTTPGGEALCSQNRFLNSEVLRLNNKCCGLETKLKNLTVELDTAREEMERCKREYVFVLQSSIRIPLHDNNSLDVMQVKLLGGDMHKLRISKLTEEARISEPSLPTLPSLLSGVYVDAYGFRHHFPDESLAVHYMATQLHEYYQGRLDSSVEHKRRWKTFLEENETIELTKDTRQLCRAGIPNRLRPTVWRLLIHQQVRDIRNNYGKYYYRNLCSLQGGDAERMFCSNHQKQINLDLLRTMPNNVHFMSANCKGVSQLQQVLRAYCLHNGNLGYCQGMNFLAATALLFLAPEDAFWFLIAMTEKYFDKSYFDGNLAGAQADQEVLKELLSSKYPNITRHLNSLDIDLATITLNWFIALFFDAVPFNTLLRIWDCFLLEGPKVLFRFALVLLGHHEEEILARSDTIGIMKVVKAAVRLSYDVDGLFKLAFLDLGIIPSRSMLRNKQLSYLEVLNEKLSKRQRLRGLLNTPSQISASENNEFPISDIVLSDLEDGVGYVIAGNQNKGQIGIIKMDTGKANMAKLDIEFDCRVVSLVVVRKDMVFAGLISGYIVALHIEEDRGTILWELKLPDIALRLSHKDGKLFAALASGTLTVLEHVVEKSPTSLELFHLPIGSAPLADVVDIGNSIWIATACKIVTVDSSSLTTMSTTYVACSSSGGSTPFFEKIMCLCPSPHGVFLATANSTLLQLWSEQGQCSLLFDITFDHQQRKPSLAEDDGGVHISSLAFSDGMLWAGTSDGYVILYAVEDSPDDNEVKYCLKRYPSGRRLLPRGSAGCVVDSPSQLVYIPTRAEANGEESISKQEFPHRRASRVSINIDQDSQQYCVSVENQSDDSSVIRNNNNNISDIDQEVKAKKAIIRRKSSSNRFPPPNSRYRRPFHKGISADSAVSVFSSECPDIMNLESKFSLFQPRKELNKRRDLQSAIRSSTASSNVSLEFDDLFELYSDDDNSRYRLSIPNPRKHHAASTDTHQEYDQSSTSSTTISQRPSISRKDLQFDSHMLIAVPETSLAEVKEDTPKEGEAVENIDTDTKPSEEPVGGIQSSIGLSLFMKLKVSCKPVRRMVATRIDNNDVLISCAGNLGEDESLLLWKKEAVSGLWINDPIQNAASSMPSTPKSPADKK